jgi:hypothetical protein
MIELVNRRLESRRSRSPAQSPDGLHSQTCANTSDQPIALTLTDSHLLHRVTSREGSEESNLVSGFGRVAAVDVAHDVDCLGRDEEDVSGRNHLQFLSRR